MITTLPMIYGNTKNLIYEGHYSMSKNKATRVTLSGNTTVAHMVSSYLSCEPLGNGDIRMSRCQRQELVPVDFWIRITGL